MWWPRCGPGLPPGWGRIPTTRERGRSTWLPSGNCRLARGIRSAEVAGLHAAANAWWWSVPARSRRAGRPLHPNARGRPTCHPPGGRRRRAAPLDASVERRIRPLRARGRAGAARAARLRAPQPVPPRKRDPRPPSRARCRAGGERERRDRRRGDPLRRQRPPRRAGRAPRRCRAARAPDRHRRFAHRRPGPLGVGVTHRGGGRDRPRARADRRRPGHRGRQRGHGLEAGRCQDRGLVRESRRSSPTPRVRVCSTRWHGRRRVSGPRFRPRERRLPARKLWIAFAIGSSGTIEVDEGRVAAPVVGGRSLLPAGVVSTTGEYAVDDAVEIAGPGGKVFAKGLVRHSDAVVAAWAGHRSEQLPDDLPPVVVHRDDMVVLA